MARPVTLCTLQWGDLPLDVICENIAVRRKFAKTAIIN